MVNIYNCGQGDCFEICPCFETSPYFFYRSLFVDLGGAAFTLPKRGLIDILITHSHSDHVLGKLENVSNVERIFVPAYYPEFLRINNRLKNQISKYKGFKFELLYEGKKINGYEEIIIHNPPLNPYSLLNKNIESLPSDDILDDYLKSYETNIKELEHIVINTREFFIYERPEGYEPKAFMRVLLTMYMNSDSQAQKKYSIHNMCIVFNYNSCDSWLFTGDASIEVFERLKGSNVDLSCDILKVPHHGSRNNLTNDIVEYINPDIAIISHDNGKFGKATDPHPNQEVLDILHKNKVDYYVTNDIIKNGAVSRKQHLGYIPPYCAKVI